MSEHDSMRLAETADGSKFCIGFKNPLDEYRFDKVIDPLVLDAAAVNDDGTQTVSFRHNGFGWRDGERWPYFQRYAERVAEYLGDVTLDSSRCELDLGQTSLFYPASAEQRSYEQ